MTTNAYIFSWDRYGIESIVPITQYEGWDNENLFRLIQGQSAIRNPLHTIVRNLILRAQMNYQRHYEIYAVDCSADMDEKFWKEMWRDNPQSCAELIRARGQKIFCNRQTSKAVIT